jgi:glutamate/tyrosine decarboxylase-like PLP-dependent enzyme
MNSDDGGGPGAVRAAAPDPAAGSALDPSSADLRAMAAAAVEWAAGYLGSLRDLPVAPRASARELRERLAEPLPREGRDFDRLLATFRDVVVAGSRHNGHPRFFGYVSAPGTAAAAVADFLASTLNANLTAWRSAPAPVELERLTVDWIRQAVGCGPEWGGLFTSGGSLANFTALAAARHRHAGEDAARDGLRGLSRPLRLYVSAEGHHSIDKAAALLGLGRAGVRRVAVDGRYRMEVADLERQIAADRAAGAEPFCVVASAGTVVSGAVDPLAEVAAVARREGLWLHVDACYGGFARLAPSAAPLLAGLEDADSIALDPHKWLYLPADCGCLLFRDPLAARPAFALDADYTRVTSAHADEAFAFWDYGPELSRRFRALKVWMVLAHVGARAVGEAIESNLDCARHLAELVGASSDFELMAPVELSIFCLRHLPPATRGAGSRSEPEELELDRWNELLLQALQRDGSSYLSNARLRGRFALRGCVLNYRTTRRDMEILIADLRRVAGEISRSVRGL